jgi:hypothetical protein
MSERQMFSDLHGLIDPGTGRPVNMSRVEDLPIHTVESAMASENARRRVRDADTSMWEETGLHQRPTGVGHEHWVTKDSGAREQYDSGMVRDIDKDKPDYTLIDGPFLYRWAMLMVRGAEKYGRDNWRKADSEKELHRFQASALRHMHQWLDDDPSDNEDHAAAVAFNLAAAEMVKGKLAEHTIVPAKIVDPWHRVADVPIQRRPIKDNPQA